MKTFITLMILTFSLQVYASGCDPYDVYLEEETVLSEDSGYWVGSFKCKTEKECMLTIIDTTDISDAGHYAVFHLYLTNKRTLDNDYQEIGEVKLKRYQQVFSSSCYTGFERNVLGVEYNGMRFRSEKDLDYL